jgi:4-amino-4-deoxy-L-arabinose transferase-like glycosyltransferase
VPYIERIPSRRSILLLILLCPLLYFPNLGLRELRPSEALLGTIGYEMGETLDLMQTRAHGEHVDAFPMYPWLVTVCSALRHPTGFTTRLPAVLAVLGMALLSAYVAHRASGPLAAVVAVAMVVSNGACLRVGGRAQTETVLAFWLSAGWFSWYRLGQEKKRWTTAWLVACLCVFAGACTAGGRAVAYFYLPYFFMKRPVRGRQRLLLPAHLLGFGVLAGLLLAWLTVVPQQPFMPWNVLKEVPNVSGGYLRDLVLFPGKCAVYLLPWTFLAWTPFCLAYRPLERSPIFFRYLRTIVFSAFMFAWFLPRVSPLSLLPVLCPLAVMTGMHFEVLVRRHRKPLMRLIRVLRYIGMVCSGCALAVLFLHFLGVVSLRHFPAVSAVLGAALLMVSLCGSIWLRTRSGKHLPVWLQLTVTVAVLRLCWMATIPPLKAWSNNERKAVGLALADGLHVRPSAAGRFARLGMLRPRGMAPAAVAAEAASSAEPSGGQEEGASSVRSLGSLVSGVLPDEPSGPTGVVYRVTPNYHITATFYLGRRLVHIRDVGRDLPADDPSVIVLGEEKPPILPSRSWEALTPPLDVRRRYAADWVWFPRPYCLVEVRIVQDPDEAPRRSQVLRLYRGEKR